MNVVNLGRSVLSQREKLKKMKMKNPVILALDVDTKEQALNLTEQLHAQLGAVKIGPRLAVRYGAELISKIAVDVPVFVDNKYLDIPNTMEAAVRATFTAGATFCTVHCWSGREALERLAKVEAELNLKRPFKILAVTVLTSFSPSTLPPDLRTQNINQLVGNLAGLAISSGLSGLVCSTKEVAELRIASPTSFLVTPGIRLPSASGVESDDQKRVDTPSEALTLGANALVIGRPIYEAKDPSRVLNEILSTISHTIKN